MTNKIEYTQKEITNNQGKNLCISIIRLVCTNECQKENREQILQQAVHKVMNSKQYRLFKDDESYEYIIIEGENELEFTDITNQIL